MTKDTKKSIDIIAPILFSGAVAFFVFTRKNKDWRVLIAVVIISYIFFYAITTQVTKLIVTSTNKPDKGQLPGDSGSGGNLNVKSYTDQLRSDLYDTPFWGGHNADLWATITGLSNDHLVAIYNDWLDRYYSEYNESLIAAINADTFVDKGVRANKDAVLTRLKSLNLN